MPRIGRSGEGEISSALSPHALPVLGPTTSLLSSVIYLHHILHCNKLLMYFEKSLLREFSLFFILIKIFHLVHL